MLFEIKTNTFNNSDKYNIILILIIRWLTGVGAGQEVLAAASRAVINSTQPPSPHLTPC